MNLKNLLPFACCLSFLMTLGSCASTKRPIPYFNPDKSAYTSSFPTRDVSSRLVTLQQSLNRIISSASYKTYFIDKRIITLDALKKIDINDLDARTSNIDRRKGGTAISILQNGRHAAFITARHVVQFPDTLVSYKSGPGIPRHTFVASIGIKEKQHTYLFSHQKSFELRIIAEDIPNDIAALVAEDIDQNDISPIRLRTGAAKKLQVGSFLYILGYPLGTAMVTRGIVSAPDYDGRGNFLTDALFNHGISGGLIIATNSDFKSFEWVGMAAQASAFNLTYLIPDPSKKKQYQNLDAYTDTSYVEQREFINYGITQATPIEKILLFLYSNENKLNKYGLSSTHISGQNRL